MKKVLIFLLVLVLLAVPVSASGNLVNDGEGLLTASQIAELESIYASYSAFTPILVTTDSFGSSNAALYAADYYDDHGYPYDGILLLVSLTEGEWYILTNGACYENMTDEEAQFIGDTLVSYLRDGAYYEAFLLFPELAAELYDNSTVSQIGGSDGPTAVYVTESKNYGKTIGISMAVGLLIGLISVGIMSAMMKSVHSQSNASDYVRAGSMHLTEQRDIFLYSHVTRTPRPKSNSSGSSGGGGSRGGAGGKI